MRSKHRHSLLLLFSVAVRVFFYFFQFKGTFLEGIAKNHFLYDVIFYGIMISLLESLKERKWLIGLTWIDLIVGIAFSMLDWAQPRYLMDNQFFARLLIVVSLVFLILNVCIFFTRKSPARIFLRLLSLMMTFGFIYGAYVGIFYSQNPDNWLDSRAGDTVMAVLENLLLLLPVLRTPELRQPKYADFLE